MSVHPISSPALSLQALAIPTNTSSGTPSVFVKGTPDLILQRCTTTYDDPDSRVPVDLEIIRAAYTPPLT
jgi:hypothetical protein